MQSNKIPLLIDLDGVVFDYYGGFVKKYLERYPDRKVYTHEEMDEFYIENVYSDVPVCDILNITQAKGFFAGLEPIKGAVETLKLMLQDPDIEPFLCSSPDNDAEEFSCHSEKAESVHHYLGREWLDKMILTKDKTLIAGRYLLDDKPLIHGFNKVPTWDHIVFDQSYNRGAPGLRLNGWGQWTALRNKIVEQARS